MMVMDNGPDTKGIEIQFSIIPIMKIAFDSSIFLLPKIIIEFRKKREEKHVVLI